MYSLFLLSPPSGMGLVRHSPLILWPAPLTACPIHIGPNLALADCAVVELQRLPPAPLPIGTPGQWIAVRPKFQATVLAGGDVQELLGGGSLDLGIPFGGHWSH
jgi:hypothetical protein